MIPLIDFGTIFSQISLSAYWAVCHVFGSTLRGTIMRLGVRIMRLGVRIMRLGVRIMILGVHGVAADNSKEPTSFSSLSFQCRKEQSQFL